MPLLQWSSAKADKKRVFSALMLKKATTDFTEKIF
jgi:hypothetical protein